VTEGWLRAKIVITNRVGGRAASKLLRINGPYKFISAKLKLELTY
jgi:hypothetical protein